MVASLSRPVRSCLLPVLLLAAPAAAQEAPFAGDLAPPPPCGPAPVRSVSVTGCDVPRCAERDFVAGVIRVAGVEPGTTVDARVVEGAAQRLKKLGFFKSVEVECVAAGAAVDVALTLRPVTRVRSVRIKGNRHFYDTAIADRIPLQSGDALDPGDGGAAGIGGPEALDRVRDAVGRMYLDEGFTGTRVDVTTPEAGPGAADLAIAIVEGERLRVESIATTLRPVRQDESPGGAGYAETCPAVESRDLKAWAGLSVGQPYTERVIPDAVRRLTRALRAVGFAGVRVAVSYRPSERRLEVLATYDSCWRLRFFARDAGEAGRRGYRALAERELVEAMPFGDSGVFDLTEASLGREQVRLFFENRGYLFADVELDYRARDPGDPDAAATRDWHPAVAGVISYLVTRNARVEIRGIRFLRSGGGGGVPDDDLAAVMSTKPYDFFGDPGAVLPDQVFYDLDRIEALYRERGYLDVRFRWAAETAARVRRTERDGKDQVFTYSGYSAAGARAGDGGGTPAANRAFRVRRPPHTEGVYLEVGIDEGPRTTVRRVSVTGAHAVGGRDVMEALGLRAGGPFSPEGLGDARRKLHRRLSNEGYLGAEVTVEARADPADPLLVDVDVSIAEGTRSRVGPVFVSGTRRTEEFVVLRDFPDPGEPYDVGKVADGIRKLKDLGIFTSVQLSTVGADEKPPSPELGMVVNCREARSRFIDLAGGFETLDRSLDFPGFVASPLATSLSVTDRSTTAFGRALGMQIPDILVTAEVRYTDNNFLGRAKRLYLPFKYGLSATAWDRYAGFTPTYVDPRFFASGFVFRVTPFVIYDRATSRLDVIQFGSEFALSKEIVKRLYGSLLYEAAGVKSRDPETTTEYSAIRLENKVIPTLTYDRLDNPINPSKGGMVLASFAYINALTTSLRADNFLKWEVTAKGFWTLKNFLTFAVMARYGASMSFGGAVRLPDEERFTLGGNRGVRGFANDAIGQYHADKSLRLDTRTTSAGVVTKVRPYGGDIVVAGSVEVRFPIVRKLHMHGAGFFDFGGLAERAKDMNAASIRSSAGFGIRWLLGGTIPLRLDYGLIIDRRCRDADPVTGACILKEEVGNIHLGILYTF
ncbi:MAG: BamA/TamA family outer membrane protein [Deltaproteobacteria bacterium]|nr:BamA/TamA family outer membrane protein [Deltaproteobacteria bacterium]